MSGQLNSAKSCSNLLDGFISDSQEYLIIPSSNHSTQFDIIFYPGFSYRIVLCTEEKDNNFEISLIDEKGNIQYTNSKIVNGIIRDFRFESLFHGQIVVKQITEKKISAKILIGYKKIE